MPWTEEPPPAHPRSGLAAAFCEVLFSSGPRSRIYAIGGMDGNGNVVSTVEAYDTGQKTWSAMASMSTARSWFAVAPNPERLHALCGMDNTGTALTAHEVYQPESDVWEAEAKPMPTARSGLAAVTGPGGVIYAIGGIESNNVVATVEAYDPVTDTWTTKKPMQTPRAALTAVLCDGLSTPSAGVTTPGGPSGAGFGGGL